MTRRLRAALAALDPFILLMLGLVLLASVAPVRGQGAVIAGYVANGLIVLLFFLHGAKLSRAAIVAGFGNVRLHVAILTTTFVVFPLIGLGLQAALTGLVAAGILSGVLFLCLLPSTVQSSIAFTAIARGNVAGAVCSASLSNLLGVVLTPLLVALLMRQSAGVSADSVMKIVSQLLLPFVAGHLSRPWTGGLIARHKPLVGRIDRLSILAVVYTAFSASVVEGLWAKVDLADLAVVVMLCAVILAFILWFTWSLSGRLGFAREDRVVMLFCGSKKSLASGVPMASALFPPAVLGPVMLPLMLFHQIQLIVCAFLAGAMKDGGELAEAETV
ncbi:bile acid:sodium symporter family protein [Sphingomonas arantia]|uniref:Bile acid:sodium symporter family protein n=1 Tax=Sphingomonas arantia TaxID=1460676 RepID=A0ABW4U0R6_9SPHN